MKKIVFIFATIIFIINSALFNGRLETSNAFSQDTTKKKEKVGVDEGILEDQNPDSTKSPTTLNTHTHTINTQDPDSMFNYFIMSAIKTVSGVKPDNEFFDVNLKWKFSERLFAYGSFDIALSNTEKDSVSSSSRNLSEAGYSFNCFFYRNRLNTRGMFFGTTLKMFDTVPFYGFQVGSFELKKSDFQSSYFTLSYLYGFYKVDSTANARRESLSLPLEFRSNFYFEFSLYSNNAVVPLINSLRIKVGLLVPISGKSKGRKPNIDDIKTRIAIEVPLKGIHWF